MLFTVVILEKWECYFLRQLPKGSLGFSVVTFKILLKIGVTGTSCY